jgi:hypothetical protein
LQPVRERLQACPARQGSAPGFRDALGAAPIAVFESAKWKAGDVVTRWGPPHGPNGRPTAPTGGPTRDEIRDTNGRSAPAARRGGCALGRVRGCRNGRFSWLSHPEGPTKPPRPPLAVGRAFCGRLEQGRSSRPPYDTRLPALFLCISRKNSTFFYAGHIRPVRVHAPHARDGFGGEGRPPVCSDRIRAVEDPTNRGTTNWHARCPRAQAPLFRAFDPRQRLSSTRPAAPISETWDYRVRLLILIPIRLRRLPVPPSRSSLRVW